MANLAGLAALAALGYGAHKYFNRDEEKKSPTNAAARALLKGSEDGPTITPEMRANAIKSGNDITEGERVAMSKPNVYDTEDARPAVEAGKNSSGKPSTGSSTRSVGSSSANPRDLEASMSRGRRAPDVQSDSGYTGQGGSGRGGQGGPTAEEMARYVQVPNSSQTQAGLETMMGGGPGLKALSTMAKGMANTKRAAPYIQELANNPTRQLAYDKAGAVSRAREARSASRQDEMLRENARRSGLDPDNINPAVAQKVRENLGGSDFSLPMKRGGAVKKMASGGMTSKPSSASKRGDGIAQKGKTNCKMR